MENPVSYSLQTCIIDGKSSKIPFAIITAVKNLIDKSYMIPACVLNYL